MERERRKEVEDVVRKENMRIQGTRSWMLWKSEWKVGGGMLTRVEGCGGGGGGGGKEGIHEKRERRR